MKNKKDHLPMIGVGPIIVIPQLIITAVAIVLSEIGKLYAYQVHLIKIQLIIVGSEFILF